MISRELVIAGMQNVNSTYIKDPLSLAPLMDSCNSTWGGTSGITDQEFKISPDNKSIQGTWRNDTGQGIVSMIRVY